MTTDERWIEGEAWETIVANVPLVSVDLIVRHDGGVVLGKRTNEPAKGEWFVPGGVVFKNESLTDAVHRVARDELGCDVTIVESLGAFEHFFDTSEVDGVETKHYLANAFVVDPDTEEFTSDDQHAGLRVFEPPFDELHPYVLRYLDAASDSLN
ncbi:GDP-mannose mannosyl hydrolase [Salinigranum halophilum]|uniref:GDP-mannose mannosyl hydrolase n=1 Tax=Salinigranum halophilum TaxID=2565931 RepID=UPI0010A79E5F|nr:NUDIX domain-containing protein [Salinigranum halophilum]